MKKYVEIIPEAANALAWFTQHNMYGDDISEVIMDFIRKWCAREHKTIKDLAISDREYEDYLRREDK